MEKQPTWLLPPASPKKKKKKTKISKHTSSFSLSPATPNQLPFNPFPPKKENHTTGILNGEGKIELGRQNMKPFLLLPAKVHVSTKNLALKLPLLQSSLFSISGTGSLHSTRNPALKVPLLLSIFSTPTYSPLLDLFVTDLVSIIVYILQACIISYIEKCTEILIHLYFFMFNSICG